MQAANSQAFRVHPAHPQACGPSEGSLRHGLPGGKVCGTVGVGGRVGRDGPSGGVAFSCSQREIGGHRCYCLEGRGGPGMRGARQDL